MLMMMIIMMMMVMMMVVVVMMMIRPIKLISFSPQVVLHDHREDPLPQSRGFVIGTNCTAEVEIDKHVVSMRSFDLRFVPATFV